MQLPIPLRIAEPNRRVDRRLDLGQPAKPFGGHQRADYDKEDKNA